MEGLGSAWCGDRVLGVHAESDGGGYGGSNNDVM